MINAVSETLSQKTTAQYMTIEDRYATLKRYLRLLIKNNRLDVLNVELILQSLDDQPLEEDKENEST